MTTARAGMRVFAGCYAGSFRLVSLYSLAMRIVATFGLSALLTVCSLLTTVSTGEQKSAPIVIAHATVINPGTSSVQANRTVVITGHHITSVSATEEFQSPKNTQVIDATDQYLIPGLWDMHVHSAFGDWFPGGRDIILTLFIANGVTGVRDMGGDTPILLEWRKEIADGRIIGPRMVISGPMLDGRLSFAAGLPAVYLEVWTDTHHFALAQVEAFARDMEAVVVEAAFDPTAVAFHG